MNFVGIALLNGIIPTQTGTNFVMKIGARSMWPGKIDYETNKIRWAYRLHKYIFRFRYHSIQYKANKDTMAKALTDFDKMEFKIQLLVAGGVPMTKVSWIEWIEGLEFTTNTLLCSFVFAGTIFGECVENLARQ